MNKCVGEWMSGWEEKLKSQCGLLVILRKKEEDDDEEEERTLTTKAIVVVKEVMVVEEDDKVKLDTEADVETTFITNASLVEPPNVPRTSTCPAL